MRQSITWLGVSTGGSLTRTVVHFFPSSGGVSAPYPATCKLTLLGLGGEPRSVLIEGARLSQPDGIWIDDAFPALRETGGMFGLLIELATAQPRTDLSASGVVIEYHSGFQVSRFLPVELSESGVVERRGSVPLLKDGLSVPSLVVINGSEGNFSPVLTVTFRSGKAERTHAPVNVGEMPPFSAREVVVPAAVFDEIPVREVSWGALRCGSISLGSPTPQATTVFALYRDATTQQLQSVSAL